MKQRSLFIIVMVTLLIAASCTAKESNSSLVTQAAADDGSKIDSGLFSTSSCKPPCWQNLIPGKSNNVEVDSFISSLGDIGWPFRKNHPYESKCVWKRIIDSERHYMADFYLESETLTFIQWSMPPEITLEQIVDYYGPPQYFRAVINKDYYFLDVYYPALGMAFEISPRQEDISYILPDMPIRAAQYFSSGDINSYLFTKFSCSYGVELAINAVENEINNIQPWSGYGEIKAISYP
ncbi:MAG: hypothetical protein HY869_09295 [Chloroflexi bacterium]|nr:hypothetical protein [Chloroflexota bacterium]